MVDINLNIENAKDKNRLRIKIYVVFVPVSAPKPGEPNVSLYAAKLRQKDAEKLAESIPGAFWRKVVADKF